MIGLCICNFIFYTPAYVGDLALCQISQLHQRPTGQRKEHVMNVFKPFAINTGWAGVLGSALTLQHSGDDEAAVECLIGRLPEGPELAFCLNKLAERELFHGRRRTV